MRSWLNDFRYGARMILKRPGTSGIAIVALALGIGLTAVMFSVVQGAILRGLPFEGGDRIMLVSRARLSEPGQRRSVPVDDLLDWRERQQSFEGLAAYGQRSAIISAVSGDSGYPERFTASEITPNTLSLLRVRPMLGRDFTDADAAPGAPPVVLISHRVWTSRFGGEASVVGQDLRVNGTLTRVIGVMPERFGFPQTGELWLPRVLERPDERGQGATVRVIGRLKDGVDERQAITEMRGIAAQLATTHEANADITATLGPFVKESIGDEVVATLFTMLGAVFGVMLIACVNVTNLQLARAAERTKEVAIRTALGAGRWRIVRQLLAEGLLLSAAGAALGLAIAWFGTAAFMRAIVDTQPPFWIDVRLDPTVIAFVVAITVAAALVSSVLPGWRVARADPNLVLKDETRGATGLRMGAFSRWLVVVEVTASCVLLVVSGLMIRSIVATSRFDYPFATKDVFYAQVSLQGEADAAAQGRWLDQLEERLGAVPGVRRAALATSLPGQQEFTFSIEGVPDPPDDERPRAGWVAVDRRLLRGHARDASLGSWDRRQRPRRRAARGRRRRSVRRAASAGRIADRTPRPVRERDGRLVDGGRRRADALHARGPSAGERLHRDDAGAGVGAADPRVDGRGAAGAHASHQVRRARRQRPESGGAAQLAGW
jgi:predicted permease